MVITVIRFQRNEEHRLHRREGLVSRKGRVPLRYAAFPT